MSNKLTVLNNITLGENGTIKSVDLVEIINHFREEEFNIRKEKGLQTKKEKCVVLEHNKFVKSCEDEYNTLKILGLEGGEKFFVAKYLDKQGKERPCLELTEEFSLQMLNKESVYCRAKTVEYIKQLKQENKQLKEEVKELDDACKIEDKDKREYARKKSIYGWKALRNTLESCTYKNIEDTVNDIIDFHVNILKKKDRAFNYSELDKTSYKQAVRDRIYSVLDDIYRTTGDIVLRTLSSEMKEELVKDKVKTINRSSSHIINGLKSELESKEIEHNQVLQIYKPNDEDYIAIQEYPISKNALYEPHVNNDGTLGQHCTDKYKNWRYWFKRRADEAGLKEAFKDVNFDEDVFISYKLVAPYGYDVSNLINPLQDILVDYFDCEDDQNFHICNTEIVGYFDDIRDGQIQLYLCNRGDR